MIPCRCAEPHPAPRIVLTGGPGAGKTAVLELLRRSSCRHVRILPESAGIVFGGGFPREESVKARKAAQRAIHFVQTQLETLPGENGLAPVLLCDRGTVDGAAYWPGPEEFFASVGSTAQAELARYAAVIHLRTPAAGAGYNLQNPLRVESAAQAAAIDERIALAWAGHPARFVVESSDDFLQKAHEAVRLVRAALPPCCRPPPGDG